MLYRYYVCGFVDSQDRFGFEYLNTSPIDSFEKVTEMRHYIARQISTHPDRVMIINYILLKKD